MKFVKSPYSLSLVSTSAFIKPELPYNIQVCVQLLASWLAQPRDFRQLRFVNDCRTSGLLGVSIVSISATLSLKATMGGGCMVERGTNVMFDGFSAGVGEGSPGQTGEPGSGSPGGAPALHA